MATIPKFDKDGNADGTLEMKAERDERGLLVFLEDENGGRWPMGYVSDYSYQPKETD